MHSVHLALPALLVALVTPVQNHARTQDEGFSVVVSSTATEWAVECERGCDWKASFTCDGGCAALVDSRGVVTLGEIRGPDPVFQFLVSRANGAIVAEARSGTYWKTISWRCGGQPCRMRVSETGVAPLR